MTAETPSPTLPPRWQRVWRWGAASATLAAVAWVAVNCYFNPDIPFLPPGPGNWIVYPLPARFSIYTAIPLTGTFRRSFVLTEKPAAAWLELRCFTNGLVMINRQPAPLADMGNWKTTSRIDVAPFLRSGSNEISVSVVNANGPPALSLKLESENFLLASDETWEVSVSGSEWRPARWASATPQPGKGNHFEGLETTADGIRRCWPWLCVFAGLAAGAVALGQFWIGRLKSTSRIILALISAAWLLLFWHNIGHVPPMIGFDGADHLNYIKYIQAHHELPSGGQGWEMFQPPLYYFGAAEVLGVAHLWADKSAGGLVLRYINWIIGAAQLALVYVGLRLLFGKESRRPLIGLALAAFLPAELYLLHYPTNETLAAMFATGALCVGLYLLPRPDAGWGWFGWLGVLLGLALLSKVSALLVLPPMLFALALKLMLDRERRPAAWVKNIAVPLLVCLVLSGWHYWRLWRDFGNPLAGNWNARVAQGWWQAMGYRTPGYFLGLGHALSHPFLSGMDGFWDGFYTTLWGDGLFGGCNNILNRPPWNYDFMAAGFILALVPTFFILTGLARAVAASLRAADPAWIMLLGVGWLYALAIVVMALRVPSYAQVKAFYGLPALLPFCALGADGFDYWRGRGRAMCFVMSTALCLWCADVYATYWIQPDTVQNERCFILAEALQPGDHSDLFRAFLQRHPNDPRAVQWLVLAHLDSASEAQQSAELARGALKVHPDSAALELSLAAALASSGHLDEGTIHARRAMELAPENELGAQVLIEMESERGNYVAAIEAGRNALSINPTDARTHFNMALALVDTKQIPEAISHLIAIAGLKDMGAQAQYMLSHCFFMQGKHDEGLEHLREAVQLNPDDPKWQAELQRESGRR